MALACNPSIQEGGQNTANQPKPTHVSFSEMGFPYARQKMTGTVDHVQTLAEAKH